MTSIKREKTQKMTSVDEDVEKMESLYTSGRNVNSGDMMENSMTFPSVQFSRSVVSDSVKSP